MTDSNNTYLPQLSTEDIERVKAYQSKNDPIIEEYLENGNTQYSYDSGYIIEEDKEGNIVRILKMTQEELNELLNIHNELKKSLEPSIIRAERIKKTGIH